MKGKRAKVDWSKVPVFITGDTTRAAQVIGDAVLKFHLEKMVREEEAKGQRGIGADVQMVRGAAPQGSNKVAVPA